MTALLKQAPLRDLAAVLLERNVVTRDQYALAEKEAQTKRVPTTTILEQQGYVRDEDLAKARAEVFQIPYIDPTSSSPSRKI